VIRKDVNKTGKRKLKLKEKMPQTCLPAGRNGKTLEGTVLIFNDNPDQNTMLIRC
jgi:hypothetical protein